jgi:hypothetical protein
MRSPGDGLNTIKEYRGYILDGGPDVPAHKHKRLSIARKELLVECSEMDGIRDVGSGQWPNPGNQANSLAQGYDLTATMEKVSWFYRNEQVGGVMDLYWVRDRLVDEGPVVVYQDWTWRPSAYRHEGDYYVVGQAATVNGWLSIALDRRLEIESPTRSLQLYGTRGSDPNNPTAPKHPAVGVMSQNDNRNLACSDFLRVAFQGRRGWVDVAGDFNKAQGGFAEGFGEAHPNPAQRGAHVFVNSMSEESPYTTAQFFGKLTWSVAHELGHLFIIGQQDPPMDIFDHTTTNGFAIPGVLMGESLSLDACMFHEKEIQYTNLPDRASIGL